MNRLPNASRAEVLRLYREILRTCKQFDVWQSPQGEPWSVVLRRSARKEFDQAKYEADPTMIAKMIYVGYDCLNTTKEKFQKALTQPKQDNGGNHPSRR